MTLQLWTQVVGKVRLTLSPWLNHGWQVPLYVNARGLGSSPIHAGGGMLEIDFDFVAPRLVVRTSDGLDAGFELAAMSVASFYRALMTALDSVGVKIAIDVVPNEVSNPIPFPDDETHAAFDAAAARSFWHSLVQVDRVFHLFRTAFLGKSSPVHFFWGSNDLAVTRFSGRKAPRHPGGVPNLPDNVAREAYSHEVSSAGFWPGGGGVIDFPAFYSYAYPAPEGFAAAKVAPDGAFFSKELGEFILPYDAVRTERDPGAALMAFLQSTYAAAADLGKWDRAALECGLGEPGKCREI